MLFINHIKAKVCCEIITNINIEHIIKLFFSMFNITVLSLGYKSIGTFILDIQENYIHVSFKNKEYIFDSIYECLQFVSDAFLTLDDNENSYFHGAVCVNSKGKAIALIGESMAGKTSLNMFLYKNGFQYLSDDIVIVTKDLKVLSMPTPIKVRRGIIFDDPFFDKYVVHTNNDYKILTALTRETIRSEYTLSCFVFLHRGYALATKSLPSSQLMVSLLNNFAPNDSMSKNITQTATIARNIQGIDLYYQNLDTDLIELFKAL